MADDDIMETRREGCLVLTLNRPARLNAWTEAMRARLVERLTAAASDRSWDATPSNASAQKHSSFWVMPSGSTRESCRVRAVA